MIPKVHFGGPVKYQIQGIAGFFQSALEAGFRRVVKGPRRESWSWFLELATQVLKQRMVAVFEAGDIHESRRYLDTVQIKFPQAAEVSITPVHKAEIAGSWFSPKNYDADVTTLYFHGGGYSFYPSAYSNFIALIALATRSKLFALDYSLAPEHRFPTQLEEGLLSYRWLLESGINPESVIIAGDSAGGNLTLAVLQAVRDEKLPLPALAIAISPPTDFSTEYTSMDRNQDVDWIDKRMARRWADWFCDPHQRQDPLVSPHWADLRGLPPIYIQAGIGEILYDAIQAFADRAKSEGIDLLLESWKDMTHDFQIFGPYVPQSADALRRLGEIVDIRVRQPRRTGSRAVSFWNHIPTAATQ